VQAPAAQEGRDVSYADPDVILESIRDLSSRLDASETRLIESRRRVESLSKDLDGRNSRIAAFEKTVSDLQTAIDNQRRTIVSLTEQLESLQRENVQLVMHNEELTRTVDDMTVRENTAWYIVGTKEELLEKGIVTEKGGSRVLFVFGKRGRTLVPARDIDLSLFNQIDVTLDSDIPLPDPGGEYSVVSLQDLSALGNLPDDDERYTGEALHIVDPGRFWANNRVLVVVLES
jgi:archaellum component FlaC